MAENLRPPPVRIRDPRYGIEARREERELAEQERPRKREPDMRSEGTRLSADGAHSAGGHEMHD
jgi:hypothetical protein